MEINLFILLGIILIALVVQYIVEALKLPIAAVLKCAGKKDKVNPLLAPFLSLAWAVALCILADCDLFVAFGYPLSEPYIGAVSTGIVASLGASKVYELITSFREYKDKIAVEKAKEVG